MRTILGFIEIENFTTIAFEKTNMMPIDEVEKSLEELYLEVVKQAVEF